MWSKDALIRNPPKVIAVDPGSTNSAMVAVDSRELPVGAMLGDNDDVRATLADVAELVQSGLLSEEGDTRPILCIEAPRARGMPASNQLFETCIYIGRLVETWAMLCAEPVLFVDRLDVKLALCGVASAKDTNIRAAVIEHYGGQARAVGLKKNPGPLYGFKKDLWQAQAVALTVLCGPANTTRGASWFKRKTQRQPQRSSSSTTTHASRARTPALSVVRG